MDGKGVGGGSGPPGWPPTLRSQVPFQPRPYPLTSERHRARLRGAGGDIPIAPGQRRPTRLLTHVSTPARRPSGHPRSPIAEDGRRLRNRRLLDGVDPTCVRCHVLVLGCPGPTGFRLRAERPCFCCPVPYHKPSDPYAPVCVAHAVGGPSGGLHSPPPRPVPNSLRAPGAPLRQLLTTLSHALHFGALPAVPLVRGE